MPVHINPNTNGSKVATIIFGNRDVLVHSLTIDTASMVGVKFLQCKPLPAGRTSWPPEGVVLTGEEVSIIFETADAIPAIIAALQKIQRQLRVKEIRRGL